MQKINVFIIVRDHITTLRDDKTGKFSWIDFNLFFVSPCVLGALFYFFPFRLPDGIETALIAVFSVFGALLFSAQVALYGLSPAKPDKHPDSIQDAKNRNKYETQKAYFKDVNFNVSYLILLSCTLLVLFLLLMILCLPPNVEGAFLVTSVLHFFLSLMMLVKRSHVAFSLGHNNG